MIQHKTAERWKDVNLGNAHTNDYRLQISDFGNLRTFNQHREAAPLNGTLINGYRIIRIKLLKPKDNKAHQNVDVLQKQLGDLRLQYKSLKHAPKSAILRRSLKKSIVKIQQMLSAERAQERASRTINYHALFHRLVAMAFITPGSSRHVVVGHLDYDKLNNNANNLHWMTPEENYQHQQLSPRVIRERKDRITLFRDHPRNAKLTVVQVAEIKKGLKQNRTSSALAEQFEITATQILRIKNGLNWSHVKPAK